MNTLYPQETGVDLVRIDRMKQHVNDLKFLNRVLNPEEIEQVISQKNPEVRLAGRWAAKEAVSKALGYGIGERLAFKDISILNDQNGRPRAYLNKEANERFKFPVISLSISHDGDYAIAFVVVQFPS